MCLQVGYNCLHVAIIEGDVGIVKKLLGVAGCELTRMEVSVLIMFGSICLAMAVALENLPVNFRVQGICSPFAQSPNREPPVLLAAAHGRGEMLEFLLDNYQNLCSPQDSSKVGARCMQMCALCR